MRTAAALVCPPKESTVTAGSATASSSGKRNWTSTIKRLLERGHADAAISIEETFAILTVRQIDVGGLFYGIDDAVLAEAGAGDLAQRRIRAFGTAQQQLEVLHTSPIDTQHADMAGVVMPAGVDAARNLELQFAQRLLPVLRREAFGNLLCQRDRAGIGQAAIIEAGAGDDIADQIEIGCSQARRIELLPQRMEIGLAHMREDDVLRMG